MKKALSRENIQIFAALLLLAVMILPMLALCAYVTPVADDFSNGGHLLIAQRSGSTNALVNAFNFSAWQYMNWQGTYFGCFLIALFISPVLEMGGFLNLYCALVILCFLAVLFFLVRTVLAVPFGPQKNSIVLWVYTGLVFLCTQINNLSELFYWFTGSAVYTLPVILALFGCALALHAFKTAKKRNRILLTASASFSFALACGGALVVCAFLCCISLAALLYALYYKMPWKGRVIVLFAVCLAFTLVNVLAPGYFVRREVGGPPDGTSLLQLMIISLNGTLSAIFSSDWLSPGILLAVFLFLLPLLARVVKTTYISVPHPIPVIFYSFASMWGVMLPICVAWESDVVASRYMVCAQWFLCLLVLLNCLCILAWLREKDGLDLADKKTATAAVLAACVSFCLTVQTEKPIKEWNSYMMLQEYSSHNLQEHVSESRRIINALKYGQTADIAVQMPSYQSPLLHPLEVSADPNSWVNITMAGYYGKNSLVGYEPPVE